MKYFIHNSGLFEVFVPDTWLYTPSNDVNIHTFTNHSKDNSYIFYIIIVDFKNESRKSKLINKMIFKPIVQLNNLECYCHEDELRDSILKKRLTTICDDKYIKFIMTAQDASENIDSQKYFYEMTEIMYDVLKEFRFIPEDEKPPKIALFRLNEFLQWINYSKQQLGRAFKKSLFVEALCLLSNLTDSYLRLAILLKTQIMNNTSDIDISYIYQDPTTEWYSERDIMLLALELGIIDQEESQLLIKMNASKNRVFYQIILLRMKTDTIKKYIGGFNFHLSVLSHIVNELMTEQIKSNIGFASAYQGCNIDWDVFESIQIKFETPLKFLPKDITNRIERARINFETLVDRWS